ncbi:hypothetical protein ACFSHT_04495 [Paraburkholderia silviterrae]|uniref:Uncharacterized protein n=1 Tax=Paraburkholderia silviterrae TaxID=2528715 RepID=A0A4R5M4K0_9BURK|nr:hypothetical protein [Paraburkholderia silviterrae]TDG20060.1 hypothetical protein EYW47_28315 [Paraburkholderia silviterrae]
MTTPDRPERESDETWEPGQDASEGISDPRRLTRGAWLSLAMSLAFFVTMVTISVKFDSAHHPRAKPAEPERSALASEPAPVPVAAITPPATAPADDPDALLAQARECAAAAHWDCVIEATSGVIAQRGNTPETKALLAQAMIKGGWVPGKAPAPALSGTTHYASEFVMAPPEPKRAVRHRHRHTERLAHLRYTSANRSNMPDDWADIYRH